MEEDEFASSWENPQLLDAETLHRVVEEALPFIPAVVWSAPVPNSIGIHPAETAHVYVDEDGVIHVDEIEKKWLVRSMQLREDPGFYKVYPSEAHSTTKKYNAAKPDSPEAQALEKKALDYAKERITKFDALLQKIANRSGGDLKIPKHGTFYGGDEKNPVLLRVVEYIDGIDIMDPENPGLFSEEAKKIPGLHEKLDRILTTMSTEVGELPHNTGYVPTDIFGGWRQFRLKKPQSPGEDWDAYMIDLDPYVGQNAEERPNTVFGIRKMAKHLEQLPKSTPLPPALLNVA